MEHPLRTYRRQKRLSLEALAEATGASKATLSRIENGKQDPSLMLIRKIGAATKGAVTANDFMPPAAEQAA